MTARRWFKSYAFAKYKYVYIMLVPVMAYYLIFHYGPMYGAVIAFKDFSPFRGILGSPWVGLRHFKEFFGTYYFWRLIRNTLSINLLDVAFGFPAPIILAVLLNEVANQFLKRTVQTITYMPHFISTVVVVGMIIDFFSSRGVVNAAVEGLGGKAVRFLTSPPMFQPLFVGSGIWQHIGWGSIVYLAALSGVNPQLYEQARVDGASRFQQLRYITLPGLAPTIIVLLILRLGRMMTVGFEKILLLYNPTVYETADVISTFVYRKGLWDFSYSYASAVGLFNSVINFALLVTVNQISRKVTETSLW